MTKRLLSLFRQDLVITYRNGFIWVILLTLAIMLALTWFLPESFSVEADELFYDATAGGQIKSALVELGAEESVFYGSQEALIAELEARKKGIGVVIEGDLADLRYTFFTQGRVAEENLNVLGAALDSVADGLRGEPMPENLELTLLRQRSEPVPMNLAGVPIYLVFEVVALGFFLVAAVIFQEKQEGTIRAFQVSPAGTLSYILSKNAVFLVLSLAYGVLLLLLGMGPDVPLGRLLIIILLSSSMMTMAGIFVAVFFNNVSEWFFVGAFVLLLNMLPVISYAMPAFAPAYITWIPSYPVVFSIRELLFPTGKEGFVLSTAGLLAVYNVVVLAAAYWAVHTRLMTEGR